MKVVVRALVPALLFASAALAICQVTASDYDRAFHMQDSARRLVQHVPGAVAWDDTGARFVYRRSAEKGAEYLLVDVAKKQTTSAFDATRLAAELAHQQGTEVDAAHLPLENLHFENGKLVVDLFWQKKMWHCDLSAYRCESHEMPPRDPEDEGYDATAPYRSGAEHGQPSPDGKWLAYVENYNLKIRPAKGSEHDAVTLSEDGSEGNYYAVDTISWSPDSSHLAAYRIRPGYRRVVHYVESSPEDQLQPKHSVMVYPKAGDTLALPRPVIFDLAKKQATEIDNALFPNPYDMAQIEWRKDSRSITFEYNQRGHQIYRVIEADAATGKARTVIEESSATFINYEPLIRDQYDHGKRFRQDLDDGRRILWASERDGWEHLYWIDATKATVESQITKGPWVVRAVDRVDEKTKQIFFEASGRNSDEDPYFVHAYRLNFDGTGLTELSREKADHTISYSADGNYFVDLYSQVNVPPVMVVKESKDGSVVMDVDHADDTALRATGWKPAEPFHALGRDGKTEIWGVIWKPRNFDPSKKYPVVEDIYAGPQGSFVPKSYTPRVQPLTELGFVVVQIDGMGTNNRSRAFHDVAWHNLKDAGFEDRILWHKAAAKQFPWYDISHVGVFGTSAGGQNAMAALLFHPEFYQAGVANCGSHDNRMDKIWWNEQWMGWPVGPWYSESSNVDNAWRLKGNLMLVVGEMDKNVDPSTTLQVADRLIKAGKDFDLLFVPGDGHGAGGQWSERRLMDFFVQHLKGESTPAWNAQEKKAAQQ